MASDQKAKGMADQLKPYEKAGRAICLMAWLSLVLIIVGVAAFSFAFVSREKSSPVLSAKDMLIILAVAFLSTYFQLLLGAAIKRHKRWGRKAGIGYGIIVLFGFPLGTIVGGYTLYCLIKGWSPAVEKG
jgi:hypothetical protein